MTEWATFIPLVAVVVGTLLSALMGMTLSKLIAIERYQREANGRCREHTTTSGIHINPNSFDKVDEQIKTLYNTVRLAHGRLDSLGGAPGPRGLPGPQGERGERGERG